MTQSIISTNPSIINTFNFGEQSVRVVIRDGEPWFVAADVCAVLGIKNITMALRRLDSDEQALNSIEGLSRGNDIANIVSESGLYALIFSSRKPEAKRFTKWVTSEVLPSIRKTGGYQLKAALGTACEDGPADEPLHATDLDYIRKTIRDIVEVLLPVYDWPSVVEIRLCKVLECQRLEDVRYTQMDVLIEELDRILSWFKRNESVVRFWEESYRDHVTKLYWELAYPMKEGVVRKRLAGLGLARGTRSRGKEECGHQRSRLVAAEPSAT